jgi:hypothetical protein
MKSLAIHVTVITCLLAPSPPRFTQLGPFFLVYPVPDYEHPRSPLPHPKPPSTLNINSREITNQMHSKSHTRAINQSDLTSSLSSIARKQNVLAGVPPALRLLPLAAFAAGDLYERRHGRNPLEGLLGPGEGRQVDVGSSSSSSAALGMGPLGLNLYSCAVCSRRGLDAFRKCERTSAARRFGIPPGFEVLRFYDGWAPKVDGFAGWGKSEGAKASVLDMP